MSPSLQLGDWTLYSVMIAPISIMAASTVLITETTTNIVWAFEWAIDVEDV
jgi:hypothetical protein